MSVRLLDANVLIALAWPQHIHHECAHDWFSRVYAEGWATCSITQLAFVRIVSNPRFSRDYTTPSAAIDMLQDVTHVGYHHFWDDDLSITASPVQHQRITEYRQLTDAHLMGLAMRRNGVFATFAKGVANLLSDDPADATVLELIPWV